MLGPIARSARAGFRRCDIACAFRTCRRRASVALALKQKGLPDAPPCHLPLALVAAVPAIADDVYTQAPVAAATVYPAGAELTHRAQVELARRRAPGFPALRRARQPRPRCRGSAPPRALTIGTLGFRARRDRRPRGAVHPGAGRRLGRGRGGCATGSLAQATRSPPRAPRSKALDARLAFLGESTPGEETTRRRDPRARRHAARDETAASAAALVGGARPSCARSTRRSTI